MDFEFLRHSTSVETRGVGARIQTSNTEHHRFHYDTSFRYDPNASERPGRTPRNSLRSGELGVGTRETRFPRISVLLPFQIWLWYDCGGFPSVWRQHCWIRPHNDFAQMRSPPQLLLPLPLLVAVIVCCRRRRRTDDLYDVIRLRLGHCAAPSTCRLRLGTDWLSRDDGT